MRKVVTMAICMLLSVTIARANSDTSIIHKHLIALSTADEYRNYKNPRWLNSVASYIENNFSKYSDHVSIQEFEVEGNIYKNVICSFGTEHKERIVVGAHYDVCDDQAGADDNASGVAGLLELARMLKNQPLNYRIDIVAYSLEEPPFFRSEFMGSYIHAKSLVSSDIELKGMVCLEMIGYYDDEPNSQTYPIKLLKLVYDGKGNYITLVRKIGYGKFSRTFSRLFKKNSGIKTKKFIGPASLAGIDFSDHLNYWNRGFSALMITDTAFYRNKNYHTKEDTMEKLSIPKMALVIDAVFEALVRIR